MNICVETVVVGSIQTNCYIVACRKTGKGFVIDPGDEHDKIASVARRQGVTLMFILNTHGHIDHIKDDAQFGIPVHIHEMDAGCLRDPSRNLSGAMGMDVAIDVETVLLQEGDILQAGEMRWEVLHTPGHSPGSICIASGSTLFSGDTLFREGCGRTDLPGGSDKQLAASLRRLLALPETTAVYPGHGPSTTIGLERESFAI